MQSNQDVVDSFLNDPNGSYMLTISRDGESPVRSIYIFNNAIDAVEGYNRYTDWGFAKKYLTVRLYQPDKRFFEKVIYAPKAGECVFHRDQYYKISEYINEIKSSTDIEKYEKFVYKMSKLLSQDNWRFDPDRFISDCGCTFKAIE